MKLFRILALAATVCCSASCVREAPVVAGNCDRVVPVMVAAPYSVAKGEGTRAIGTAGENTIETLDVLAFEVNGGVETFLYVVEAQKDAGNTEGSAIQSFRVKLRVGASPQRFVFITNARSRVRDLVGWADDRVGEEKEALLSGLTFDLGGADRWNATGASDFTAIPMWGESEPRIIDRTTTSIAAGAIPLIRMVARVGVQLDVAGDPTLSSRFRLKSVRLYNTSTSGRVVPRAENITDNVAQQPSLPASVATAENPTLYTDFSAPGVTDVSMQGAIYLFERANAQQEDILQQACVVVGGIYGDDPQPTYYRLDYLDSDGTARLDILRNHRYNFIIRSVSGRGYTSEDDAWRSRPFNMAAEVLVWNETNVAGGAFDGYYTMSVDKTAIELGGDPYGSTDSGNRLRIRTDYPDGWTIAGITDAATGDGIPSEGWLTVSDGDRSGVDKTIALTVAANNSGVKRSANIRITAGRMSLVVTLSQEPVYSGGHADLLYFAAGGVLVAGSWAEMDETARANIAFFKFGGVVGFTNLEPGYGAGELHFNPTGAAGYDVWSNIPAYDAADLASGKTNTSLTHGTRAYHTGANVQSGKGDPCRLVGLSGAAVQAMSEAQIDAYRSGWRMPTLEENVDFVNAPTSYYDGGSTSPMDDGTYPFWGADNETTGGWFPIAGHRESSTGRGPLGSDPNGFIPARGMRGSEDGHTHQLFESFCWASSEVSAAGEARATYGAMEASSTGLLPVYDMDTGYGTMRRCVKDGEVGVTTYPPVLLHKSNTLPAHPAKIAAGGGPVTITASTNLQGWGVKVFMGENTGGTPIITKPASPSPSIAPNTMAVESSVTIEIPENLSRGEHSLTFLLYCSEYQGAGNEVVIGGWTQQRYYTVTAPPSEYGSVDIQPAQATGKGVEYGSTVTLTAAVTDRHAHYLDKWTATEGVTLTAAQQIANPLSITVEADVTIEPDFIPVGAQIGGYIWAKLNVDMPHEFALRPEHNGMLYQYWSASRDLIAWPTTGAINATNPGYNLNTGENETTWRYTGNWSFNPYDWPTDDYSEIPCPAGWIVPTQNHWNDLMSNADKTTANVNGKAGYTYTSKTDTGVSIFIPNTARRASGGTLYPDTNNTYNHGYTMSNVAPRPYASNPANWSIRNNNTVIADAAAASALRCVRAPETP